MKDDEEPPARVNLPVQMRWLIKWATVTPIEALDLEACYEKRVAEIAASSPDPDRAVAYWLRLERADCIRRGFTRRWHAILLLLRLIS